MQMLSRQETKMTKGISILLNNAVKMLVAQGIIGKVSAFADYVGYTEQQMVKILNGLTPLSLEEFWHIAAAIKRLDKGTTYQWLARQVMMDQEIQV